jgi:hypothetical protein
MSGGLNWLIIRLPLSGNIIPFKSVEICPSVIKYPKILAKANVLLNSSKVLVFNEK